MFLASIKPTSYDRNPTGGADTLGSPLISLGKHLLEKLSIRWEVSIRVIGIRMIFGPRSG
jgi:hypothetical protein